MNSLLRLPGFLQTIRKTRRRQVVLPRMLTYIVTFTCNARCIMCDSWKMESPNDLKLEEIEGIFAQLPRLDAVRLTGGEPFVRKDLPEIVALVQRQLRPSFLHITSNGFLTDRIVKFCEERDKSIPLNLLFSIDGPKEKHNHVRGRETAWDSVMKTLKELAPRRKELRIALAANQTIVDADGVEHYRRLREILRPLDVAHHMVMAYDASATYSLEREKELAPGQIGRFTTFGEFTERNLRDLMEEVEKDIVLLPFQARLAKRYYLRGIANRLLRAESTPNPKCVALTAHMRLYPNGDIPTCQFNSKIAGNLREQTFAEVWRSARIAEQRAWVNKCPGCWAECEVLPSAVYTGDLVAESIFPTRCKGSGVPRDKAEPVVYG